MKSRQRLRIQAIAPAILPFVLVAFTGCGSSGGASSKSKATPAAAPAGIQAPAASPSSSNLRSSPAAPTPINNAPALSPSSSPNNAPLANSGARPASAVPPRPSLTNAIFVDPTAPGPGTGARSDPFTDFDKALRRARAGDVFALAPADYGDLNLYRRVSAGKSIIVMSLDPKDPARFHAIRVNESKGWRFEGLSISPGHKPNLGYHPRFMVEIDALSAAIELTRCTLTSAPGLKGLPAWTADQWRQRSGNGLSTRAPDVNILGCQLNVVAIGLDIRGDRSLVAENTIKYFVHDGIRGTGNDSRYQDNRVEDLISVTQDHHDGFQSWSSLDASRNLGRGSGEIRNVHLLRNSFISCTDPQRPFQGYMQGIGCFDGFYVDWRVEENLVITDFVRHGISFYGARQLELISNTVRDLYGNNAEAPGINVRAHKSRGLSETITLRGNRSPLYVLPSAEIKGLSADPTTNSIDPRPHFP